MNAIVGNLPAVFTPRAVTPVAVTHIMANPIYGGAERYTIDLCRGLRRRNYRPSVLYTASVTCVEALRQIGIPLQQVDIHGDVNPLVALRVSRALRSMGSQILNVHDNRMAIPCCLGGKLARVPTVVTVHAFHGKWPFLAADHLIAVSAALRDHLVAEGIPASRISVVRSGVDIDWFTPQDRSAACRSLGLEPGFLHFACIGRLARGKGIELLMEACQSILPRQPLLRLLIAGAGPLESELKALALHLRLGHHVRFMGFHADIRPVLAASDCLVMPSVREGLGLSLLEAMAAGRATIATDSGGPREIIRPDITGLLVPAGDQDALANAILHAANNFAWMSDAGCAGRQYVVANHSLDRQLDGIEEVYHHLLA